MNPSTRAKYRYSYQDTIVTPGLLGLIRSTKSNKDSQVRNENYGTPENDALVKYTRSLKSATWIIAIASILSFITAVFQWSALSSTDTTMKSQLGEMRLPTAERPWVYFAFQSNYADALMRWEHGMSMLGEGISFKITNHGRRPATIVKATCSTWLTKSVPSIATIADIGRGEILDIKNAVLASTASTSDIKCLSEPFPLPNEGSNFPIFTEIERENQRMIEITYGQLWIVTTIDYLDVDNVLHHTYSCLKTVVFNFQEMYGAECDKRS